MEDLFNDREALSDRKVTNPSSWTRQACESEQASVELINQGLENRVTAATMLNAVSSRGHLIIAINVKGRTEVGTEATRNKYERTTHMPTYPHTLHAVFFAFFCRACILYIARLRMRWVKLCMNHSFNNYHSLSCG